MKCWNRSNYTIFNRKPLEQIKSQTMNIFNKALILSISLMTIVSCQKKKLNEELYDAAKATDLQFYKNKDTLYSGAGGSPHGSFKLKFNSTAVSSLGADGKLPVGAEFSNGSVIVKEVYSGGELTFYVVMKKDSESKFQGENWVWGEYKPNGDVAYSVSDKGSSCISCHSAGVSRDLTRSFDLH